MTGRAIASAGPSARSPGVRVIPPSSISRTRDAANTSIRRAASNSLTASLAAGPKIARGTDSGVMIAIFTSRPRSRARRWVISASS